MKEYKRISLEIINSDDVLATSSEVETGRIPFSLGSDEKSMMTYSVDSSSFEL